MPKTKAIVKTKVVTYPTGPEELLSLALTYLEDGAVFTAALYASLATNRLLEMMGGFNEK